MASIRAWIGDGVMAVRDVVQAAAGVGGAGEYIEDVFSTYLYTGTGSTQTITNGIDLDGEGGLVWIKQRQPNAFSHMLFDTARGVANGLSSNSAAGQFSNVNSLNSVNVDGFTVSTGNSISGSGGNFASWTFRKAPKFFDVVTWTGDGVSGREIPHDLGSTPGCVIVKVTDNAGGWQVYHRSLGATKYLVLNETAAEGTSSNQWNNTAPTATEFTVGVFDTNESGRNYVAYLFAHDAGGFGDDGEQNVISCGSYTGNGSADGPEIDLGFEPQWLMVKTTGSEYGWYMVDTMRNFSMTGTAYLRANSSDQESNDNLFDPTPTGFKVLKTYPDTNASGQTYIYIAIRRGPMKTPESGTEVFSANFSDGVEPIFSSGFPVDLGIYAGRSNAYKHYFYDRLRGSNPSLNSTNTSAEQNNGEGSFDNMDGWGVGIGSSTDYVSWMFRRAPGFFDVVCPNGDSSGNLSFTHNLGVSPELVILKSRTGTFSWYVYCSALSQPTKTYGILDSTFALTPTASTYFSATSTTFQTFTGGWVANNGASVAYLFASCPGVSKVGSYVGNGTTQTIDCGFSNGARFVLVKRSSNSGSWLVFDTTRGIVAGNDPYLQLNNTDAEVTNTDRLDAAASGFTVNFISGSDVDTNVNNDTYIFLAIA